MMESFIGKKKKGGAAKAINIDNIIAIVGAFPIDEPLPEGAFYTEAKRMKRRSAESTVGSEAKASNTMCAMADTMKSSKLDSAKLQEKELLSSTGIADQFINNISTISGDTKDEIINAHSNTSKSLEHNARGQIQLVAAAKHGELNAATADYSERRLKIINHATKDVDIPYSAINAEHYLPASFKQLSKLYKIIETIHRFNAGRGLSLVYAKYRESIERLFRHRVETKHLEQLYYMLGDGLEFRWITVLDNGAEVETFALKVVREADIDALLYDYLIARYKEWLSINDKDYSSARIHSGFVKIIDEIELPGRPLRENGACSINLGGISGHESCVEMNNAGAISTAEPEAARMAAKGKAADIYERIKEKERMRREAFVKEQAANKDYVSMIDNIFRIGKRRAVKLSELEFQLGGEAECRQGVAECCRAGFAVRKINGEEYVVRNDK